MFDSNKLDDFFVQDTEEKRWFHIYGYMLTKETCPICGRTVRRYQMERTYDCHGIPFRMVCPDCREKIMEEPGYDGEYYDDLDEQIGPEE